jgi:hypothetical protein
MKQERVRTLKRASMTRASFCASRHSLKKRTFSRFFSFVMQKGTIVVSRDLEVKGYGHIKPDTGETCDAAMQRKISDGRLWLLFHDVDKRSMVELSPVCVCVLVHMDQNLEKKFNIITTHNKTARSICANIS